MNEYENMTDAERAFNEKQDALNKEYLSAERKCTDELRLNNKSTNIKELIDGFEEYVTENDLSKKFNMKKVWGSF